MNKNKPITRRSRHILAFSVYDFHGCSARRRIEAARAGARDKEGSLQKYLAVVMTDWRHFGVKNFNISKKIDTKTVGKCEEQFYLLVKIILVL